MAAPNSATTSSNKAFVRSRAEEDSLTVSLVLAGRQRNLNRPKDELLEKCLARMKANAAPAPQKKDRKKRGKDSGAEAAAAVAEQEAGPSDFPVVLYRDDKMECPIDVSSSNAEAWVQGKVLQVGPELFEIVVNPPTVDKVALLKKAMVGYPLLPTAKLVFADESATRWAWSRRKAGASAWEATGCASALYVPSQADEGCLLRAECTPCSAGGGVSGEAAVAETGPVAPAPSRTSTSVRCPQGPLAPTTSPALRVMSYNILADQYAGSTYAQKVLFNYCPLDKLDPEFRKQLVLQEVAAYAPDIICLQEVDDKVFYEYLLPLLELRGYTGRYTNKMGKVKEGSATLWRTSRLRLAGSKDILLRDVFKQPLDACHSHWQAMLEASPELVTALQKVTTIAQVTLLEPVEGAAAEEAPLAVVNTHLFFHPYAPHIRTMHTAAIMEEAWALVQGAQGGATPAQGGGKRPALLFCGDLNSDLNDGIPGVVEMLQGGRLAADHWDWDMGATFKWGMEEEEGSEEQQAGAPKPPGSKIATAAAADATATSATPASATPASATPPGFSATATDPDDGDGHAFESAEAAPKHSIPVVGCDVELPCGPLRSADDLKTPFTNYTSGYKALLDYVWLQEDRMEVVGSVRVPSEEELGSFLPSPEFPSDHLAVVYDLRWKP